MELRNVWLILAIAGEPSEEQRSFRMQQQYRGPSRVTLLLALAALVAPLPEYLARADSVPESIRIQQKAEKAYETAPVVPIDRQNAHRRDFSKDAPASGDERDPSAASSSPRRDSDR
jgi:hypothetical protein